MVRRFIPLNGLRKIRLGGILSCAVLALLISALMLPVKAQEADTININEATLEELMELNGVGPVYAERIVKYREEHGPFETPEDLIKVKGIGPKIFERNRERITVE